MPLVLPWGASAAKLREAEISSARRRDLAPKFGPTTITSELQQRVSP